MIIQRLRDGTYRADFGTDGTQWAEWDPRQARPKITYSAGAHSTFKRDLVELGLGRACSSCGYLEFEHNIDGEEKAPCGGFERGADQVVSRGRGTDGNR